MKKEKVKAEKMEKEAKKEAKAEEKPDEAEHKVYEAEHEINEPLSDSDKAVLEDVKDVETDLLPEDEESEKVVAKISKKNIWTIVILIAVIVVIALLYQGKQYYDDKKEYEAMHKTYNYYTFENDGLHWKTKWMRGEQEYSLSLRHWPGELEDIDITGKLNQVFDSSLDIYLTFDAEGDNFTYLALAATELSLNINKALARNVFVACIANNTPECHIRPIVTCEDDDKAVIYLRVAEKPGIILDGNCMTIEGTDEDLVMATERILYVWYRIMPV